MTTSWPYPNGASRLRGLPLALVAVALLVVTPAPNAAAVSRGMNGPVVFTATDPDCTPQDRYCSRIYTMEVYGTEVRDLGAGQEAAVSPKDGRLAFVTDLNTLEVMDADGSNRTVVYDHGGPTRAGGSIHSPSWSADGGSIVFHEFWNYWPGDVPVEVDANKYQEAAGWVAEAGREPHLSADGSQVLFVRDAGGDPHVWVKPRGGGEASEIDLGRGMQARWMPDGRIVFTGTRLTNTCSVLYFGPDEIFVMNADGSNRRQLTSTPRVTKQCPGQDTTYEEGASRKPIPSPDGRLILHYRDTDLGGWHTIDDMGGALRGALGGGGSYSVDDWASVQPKLKLEVLDGLESDGHSKPLSIVEIRFFRDGTEVDVLSERTNYGVYNVPEIAPGRYTVRVTLRDVENRIFHIRHAAGAEALWVETVVDVPAQGNVFKRIAFSVDEKLSATNIEEGSEEELDDAANIFWQLERFTRWVHRAYVGHGGTRDDIPIHTFAETDPYRGTAVAPGSALYWYDKKAIILGVTESAYTSRDGVGSDHAPANSEWHELTHHLWNEIIPRNAASRSVCASNYVNHGGYANPDTCDSMDEGFAMFVPAVARHELEGTANGLYAWDIALEHNHAAFAGDGTREDTAVAALLWDLYDAESETQAQQVRKSRPGERAYFTVDLTDRIQLGLWELWDQFRVGQPPTVTALRETIGAGPPTQDVDGDGTPDLAALDEAFVMHGFHPVLANEWSSGPERKVWAYDLGTAELIGMPGDPRNGAVARTDHRDADGPGPGEVLVPRHNLRGTPRSNVLVRARDAAGRPLTGVGIEITASSTVQTWTATDTLAAPDGLVHLEPPDHNRYLATDGPPPCDAGHEIIGISLRGTLNGYASTDAPSFDNCTFLRAVAVATGEHAIEVQLSFPEDPDPPFVGISPQTDGTLSGPWSSSPWTLGVACQDALVPAPGNASYGCLRSEYRINGGPWTTYEEPVKVAEDGTYVFEARGIDRAGNVGEIRSETVSIDRTPVDAADDAYELDEDTVLNVEVPGVLANDTTPAPVSIEIAEDPDRGYVTLAADGSFTYQPNGDFSGTDDFSYLLCKTEPGYCEVAVVRLAILEVNDAPEPGDDDVGTTTYEPLVVADPGVLRNDFDNEGDPLTATLEYGPANGTVELSASGGFTYEAEPGFVGQDSFTYRATDAGGASRTATVRVAVRQCPGGDGGLDALDGTPAEGAVSGLVFGELEQRIAPIDRELAKALRDAACASVVPVERQVNGLT